MDKIIPRDHPYPQRPHRIYVALTNHCNRKCPWCSMYSSPSGSTFISKEQFISILPQEKEFELQLEGGEPTTHPLFWDFVAIAQTFKNCSRIILCTNGTRLPRNKPELQSWLEKLGPKFSIKVSINHHLIERDPNIFRLARMLCDEFPLTETDKTLVLNVRLRKEKIFDETFIRNSIEKFELAPWSNIFYLQKYGLASDQQTWSEPFVVGDNFNLINPDAASYGTNLISRSEAMRRLA